jgi:uncharacterized membrane protein YedE/YeeE
VRHFIAPVLSGLLFAVGLGLAGMTQPGKVLAFLQFRDPALMLTLGAAVGVTFFGFPRVLRRGQPLLGPKFFLPTRSDLDRPLIVGAALFGIGWGLVGLCPGPALVGLVGGDPWQWLFVVAMLAGMALHRLIERRP